MTGIEPFVLSGVKVAPGVALRLVTAIGVKLAKSWTGRWRVARNVKKKTGIEFPVRRYSSWLKKVAEEELLRPLGEVGADLAISLDKDLAHDRAWSDRDDRHSAALALVKETYLQSVALASSEDREVLKESWARCRHDEVLGLLAQLTETRQSFSRVDRGTLLLAQSSSRRRRRLDALGVTEDQVANALNVLETSVPAIEPGCSTVIVGSFGSGKSELAETWLRQRIADYVSGAAQAVPVWLHADDLSNKPLEECLAQHAGKREPCAIVVDGLDEVDAQVAVRIASRVATFVETRPFSTALMTARPGVLPRSEDQLPWDGLSDVQARTLVEIVSGRSHAVWHWSPPLIESVRRPFFAIGAGILLAEGADPSGQADLIRRLVEGALATPSSANPSVHDSELFELLVRAAVKLVSSGGVEDGLTFKERQQARLTRIVLFSDSRSVGTIKFSLPIFQQWFAAQHLLRHTKLLREVATKPELFDRWRWSVSIAGLAADSADKFDSFALSLMQVNPGAAAWVLDQVSSARGWPSGEANQFVNPATAGPRVLLATRTWIDSFGVQSPRLFPVRDEDQRISLQIGVYEGLVTTVWNRSEPPKDTVVPLCTDGAVVEDGSWIRQEVTVAVNGYEWPWVLVQHNVSRRMAKALGSCSRLGPVDGVWHNESRYSLARSIVGQHSVVFHPLARATIETKVQCILAQSDDPQDSQFQIDRKWVDGTDLIDLASWLRSLDQPLINRPLPLPDRDPRAAQALGMYSDQQLLSFTAEAYGQACTAYDEALDTGFSEFAWSMSTGIQGQFGVVAIVNLVEDAKRLRALPLLTMAVVPLATVEDELVKFGKAGRLSRNRRALVVNASACDLPKEPAAELNYLVHLAAQRTLADLGPFGQRSVVHRALDFALSSRPATNLALDWLWDDLKRVKIANGTKPKVR